MARVSFLVVRSVLVIYRRSVMTRWGSTSWVGLGLFLLAGCSVAEPPGGATSFGLGSGDSTGPGITTFNSTVDPTVPEGTAEGATMDVVDDSSSATGTMSGPTTEPTGPGTATEGATTEGTTTGASASSGGTSGGSTGGCNSATGDYDSCVDMSGNVDGGLCTGTGATCIYTGDLMDPASTFCSIQSCVDACDCPAAPASGDAVVSCGDLTGNPMDLFCYLDCSGGEDCPMDMICFADLFCTWPGPGAAGDPYGDCFNDPGACGLGGICLGDGAMPTIGVCTQDCNNVGDCPPAPGGGTSPVECQDLTGDMMEECFLDCSGGATCPPGMTCFSSTLCAWN